MAVPGNARYSRTIKPPAVSASWRSSSRAAAADAGDIAPRMPSISASSTSASTSACSWLGSAATMEAASVVGSASIKSAATSSGTSSMNSAAVSGAKAVNTAWRSASSKRNMARTTSGPASVAK